METFIIKRHGSNAFNQSRTPVMVVGEVDAPNEDAALDYADQQWTCYINQFFSAVPLDEATEEDIEGLNYVRTLWPSNGDSTHDLP